MPQNLDYELYFNISFYGLMGLGFVIGYFRGLKKTLYALIVSFLFYVLFFFTIELVINELWVLPIPFAIEYLTSMAPELSGVKTIGEAVFVIVEKYAGAQLGETITNDVFVSVITGLSQFVLKLVYTIFYFTLGQAVFKFIFYIFRIIFFPNQVLQPVFLEDIQKPKKGNKDKKGKKIKKRKMNRKQIRLMEIQEKKDKKVMKKKIRKMNRKEKKAYYKQDKINKIKMKKLEKKRKRQIKKPFYGALAGTAKGAFSAYIGIILLGGMLSITESFMILLPEVTANEDENNQFVVSLSTNVQPIPIKTEMATSLFEVPTDVKSIIEDTREMIDAYNENSFIKSTSKMVIQNDDYRGEVPLNLYLFDSIFSLELFDETILFRNELAVLAETANIFINSEYAATNNLSDIQGEDISSLFTYLSESKMVTSILPLAIELSSNYFETPIGITTEELYAIDWESELQTLGAVAAVGFELLNTAGILEGNVDLQTITIDGSEVSKLFDSLADSELASLGAYIALEPFLENQGGTISAIITVPEDLDWSVEFSAFGEVAEAILNTGITVGSLANADPSILISALSDMDFTVLLHSSIVSNALKNIFDGTAGIEGLDLIVVPEGIVWFDEYDVDGNLIFTGELRNILLAVNEIASVADGFDFDNLSFGVISDLDDITIDTIFNSEVLVASISEFVLDMDLGNTPLIIPDSVLDENRYLLSSELKAVAKSALVLVSDLACDEGNTACESTGFDISKAFSLSDTSIDILTTSEILSATIGNLIIDSAGGILTIPNSALTPILINTVEQGVVSKTEIKNVFHAVNILGFNDLNNMTFDISILQSLGLESDSTILDTAKSDQLFDSVIVHATLSKMLFDQTEGVSSILAVPYFNIDGEVVREYDVIDEMEYLSTSELEDILQALLMLDITDFNDVAALDLTVVIEESEVLLNSAILHATISKQIFDLGSEIVYVPYFDSEGGDVRVEVGNILVLSNTEYIVKPEIISILDSLEILGITDINTFSGSVDLSVITAEEGNIDVMLGSAIIHATISKQLIDLDTNGTIDLPHYKQDSLTEIRLTVGSGLEETEYVLKSELEAIVDAMEVLGITDIESFNGTIGLELLNIGDNAETVLASSLIQATLSTKMLNDTGGELVVPDVNVNSLAAIRLVQADIVYIDLVEMNAILSALEELVLTNFTTLDFSPAVVFSVDFDILLTSASMQATISSNILPNAFDENAGAGITTLIVPNYFREDITVDLFTEEQIELVELKALLEAIKTLGVGDFSGGMDASIISGLTDSDLDILLDSGSIHTTIDNMIRGNTNINAQIPELAKTDTVYKDDLVTKTEIKAFIKAIQTAFLGSSFTNVSFNLGAIIGLTPGEREVVADSMIIRNIITPDLETLASNPIDPYTLTAADYENNDIGTFFTKQALLNIVAYYND